MNLCYSHWNHEAKLRFLTIENTKILYAVLNWGLGHATRSMPLIKSLMQKNNKLVIASGGDSLLLLKEEFPNVEFVDLPDYGISYGRRNMIANGLSQYRRVTRAIKTENKIAANLVERFKIEMIISDNRYGVFHSGIHSVLITHQLKLMMPEGFGWLAPIVQKKNKGYLLRFNEIWVPDEEGEDNLSGALSHGVRCDIPVKFIGSLSRFSMPDIKPEPKYDFVFIISGPEPTRSQFEAIARKELRNHKGRAALVRGRVGALETEGDRSYDMFNHLNYKEMREIILTSGFVICRSGYSSLMDLKALNKKAVLIPTPGQTEQEYLATYHHGKGSFVAIDQKDFSIEKGIEMISGMI